MRKNTCQGIGWETVQYKGIPRKNVRYIAIGADLAAVLFESVEFVGVKADHPGDEP